ncbi:MAG: DUF58 domain-containing protein [Gammaproteobacteria bacterium]|nr:DUF58 domain-containing protein [Gammaproteobacteria bacterium]
MLIPTNRALIIGLVIALLGVIPSLYPTLLGPWITVAAVFVFLLVIDGWRLRRCSLEGSRDVRRVIAHRRWSDVTLNIVNTSSMSLLVKAFDMHPLHCFSEGLPNHKQLDATQSASMTYQLRSDQRGDLSFEGIQCLIASSLGLIERRMTIPAISEAQVFPNYNANQSFGALLSRRRLQQMGINRLPRPGEGSDFNQLREYRDGDSLRQIDWKATARTRKIIAREFQQERDQQIVFLLDCSQRMRHQSEHSSHMDDAINALVLLAQVALQQGDSTGLMTFGGIDRWIAPSKGANASRRLMNGLYDIEATRELPDYTAAIQNLAVKLRRRALVILITNLRNEDGDSALKALQQLNSKHLVLMADLRESDLDNAIADEPKTYRESVVYLSAEAYSQDRKQRHRLAVAGGARLLDASPENLSADLLTRYLSIKRMGQL